jgi:hypothetical protein
MITFLTQADSDLAEIMQNCQQKIQSGKNDFSLTQLILKTKQFQDNCLIYSGTLQAELWKRCPDQEVMDDVDFEHHSKQKKT